MKEIGKEIKRVRLGNKYSLAVLADMSGVDKSYLSKIERGEIKKPGERNLKKIFSALGVEMIVFLREAVK